MKALLGLEEARAVSHPTERLRALEAAAPRVRERLLAEGPVHALKVCPLINVAYPTQFAFSGAALNPSPYLWIQNRVVIVQYESDEGRKTLLFEPSDIDRGGATPFYALKQEQMGETVASLMTKRFATVQSALAGAGVKPEQVDYLFFDHLHVQDLRGWLGNDGYFPRAKLIVHEKERDTALMPHPMQAAWYIPGTLSGIADDRLVCVKGDVHLGKGLALIFTPGHTEGNMSLAVVTPRGLFVSSENGVATESWSPEHSAIAGVKRRAADMGYAVVLNGNTRDSSADQYTSMILERTLAGRSAMNADYYNVLPSSELAAWLLAPGLVPTFKHGDISFGTLR